MYRVKGRGCIMDKWEALKMQLEKIGCGEQVFAGHVIMMMEILEKNPNWDLKKDGFKNYIKE
jgi:hypothetical protein